MATLLYSDATGTLSSPVYTTAPVALSGGRVHLLALTSDNTASAPVVVPEVSQDGVEWSLVGDSEPYGPNGRRRLMVFAATPEDDVPASTITVDHGEMVLRRAIISVTGFDDGLLAVPQVAVASGDGGTGAAEMSATFPAPMWPDSHRFVVASCVPAVTGPDWAPGAGFVELYDAQAGGLNRQSAAHSDRPGATASGTFGAANAWVMIAVELAATAELAAVHRFWSFDTPSPLEGWSDTTGAAVLEDAAIVGDRGARIDPRQSPGAHLQLASPGPADYRWVSARFYFRLPEGFLTDNIGFLRVRNTNPQQAGGGGHADLFIRLTDHRIVADLMPEDAAVGPVIEPETAYGCEIVAGYRDDATSLFKVRIDGADEMVVHSTTSSGADTFRDFLFGSLGQFDFVVDVDCVEVVVSTSELDYIGPLPPPQRMSGAGLPLPSVDDSGAPGLLRLTALAADDVLRSRTHVQGYDFPGEDRFRRSRIYIGGTAPEDAQDGDLWGREKWF